MPIVSGGGSASSAVPTELAYAEFTSTVSTANTSFATAASVVSAGALLFNGGTKVRVEFFAPSWNSSAAVSIVLSLADGGVGGTELGWLAVTNVTTQSPVFASREFTPPNATKTYSVVIYSTGAATASVVGGAGGAGTRLPGFIRITTVV